MMKAIVLNGYGDRTVMQMQTIPRPQPKPNELLVKVKAASVNRADILQRKGYYPPPLGESEILGLDMAGEIVLMGHEVTDYQVGERVLGLVPGGGYAEYVCIDSELAIRMPDSMDFTLAAAIPEIFITAHGSMVELGQLQAQQVVLIHAAASGVGTACLQYAQLMNCPVFVTAGSDAKLERLKQFSGVVAGFNYKTQNFAEEIMSITQNKGVHVIQDFAGASFLQQNLSILSETGHLVMVATMGGKEAQLNLAPILNKRLHIHGFRLRSQSLPEKRQLIKRFYQRWWSYFEQGTLKPLIDSIYPLERVQDAHQQLEMNLNFGKIVLALS